MYINNSLLVIKIRKFMLCCKFHFQHLICSCQLARKVSTRETQIAPTYKAANKALKP